MPKGRYATVIIAVLLGCAETGAAATSTTTTAGPETVTTSAASESSTGVDPCIGPFAFGPPAAWTSYGRDASNSRNNTEERALDPSTIGCVVERWRIDNLTDVTSTPAVVAGRIYFGDWRGALHARAANDGTEVWTQTLPAPISDSPLVTADSVYIGDLAGQLHAVARSTGAIRWSRALDPHPEAVIYGSPILAGDRIIIGIASTEPENAPIDHTFRGSVVAVDPDDGDELWRRYTTRDDESEGAGVPVGASAAYDAGRKRIYVTTGNTYEPPAALLANAVLALDAQTGAVMWAHRLTVDDVVASVKPIPQGVEAVLAAAPNLFRSGARDVVGIGDRAGYYSVLDREDGSPIWTTQLTPGSHFGGIVSTAAIAEEMVVVASNIWSDDDFDLASEANTASVFGLDRETGTVMWQRPVGRPSFGAISIGGELAYVTSVDGAVHAIDTKFGIEVWSVVPGEMTGGGITVVDGAFYIGHGLGFFDEPPIGGVVAYALANPG